MVPVDMKSSGIASLPNTRIATTEIFCLSGLDTFTPLKALRLAQFLFTLRGMGRPIAARKTRYPDLMVFPGTGLDLLSSEALSHLLAFINFLAHMISEN